MFTKENIYLLIYGGMTWLWLQQALTLTDAGMVGYMRTNRQRNAAPRRQRWSLRRCFCLCSCDELVNPPRRHHRSKGPLLSLWRPAADDAEATPESASARRVCLASQAASRSVIRSRDVQQLGRGKKKKTKNKSPFSAKISAIPSNVRVKPATSQPVNVRMMTTAAMTMEIRV